MIGLGRRSVLRGSVGLAAAGTFAQPLHRQCGGQDRERMVDPGLRPRGGRVVPHHGRGVREGERQQDRLQPHSVRAADAEDRLGADQRRRPGCDVPRHRRPGGRPAERLERQAGRPDRRRRDPEVAIPPDGASRVPVLQQRHEEAQLLLRSLYKTAVLPFHIWNSLVEKAGYKLSDAPKTWDAFWDFFKPMQKKLRDKGMRGVYALGLQPTTTGPADGNNTVPSLPDRQWRQRHRHAGRPGRISTIRRSRRR